MGTLLMTYLGISLMVGVFLLAYFMICPLLSKRYAAKWKYWIGLAVALRLLIPFNFSYLPDSMAPQAIIEIPSGSHTETGPVSDNTVALDKNPIEAPQPHTAIAEEPVRNTIDIWGLAPYVWLGGAAAFLLYHVVGYHVTKKRFTRWGRSAPSEVANLLASEVEAMGLGGNITCVVSDTAQSPLMVGFLEHYLVLPQKNFSQTELEFIIRHELTHIKRKDIWYKLLLIIASAIHWFNPVVHLFAKQANADIELACDEVVLRGSGFERRKAYSETIIATITGCRGRHTHLTTYFFPSARGLKVRFENIMNGTEKKKGLVALVAVVMTITLVGSITAFASTAQSDSFEKLPNTPNTVNAPYTASFSADNTARIGGRSLTGNWASSDTVAGDTYAEQLDNKIAWLEQLYVSKGEPFIIEDGVSAEEALDHTGIQYMYDTSAVYRELVAVDEVLYIRPMASFSRSSDEDVLYDRFAFYLDGEATLTLTASFDVDRGNVGLFVVSPNGSILYELDPSTSANDEIKFTLGGGLYSLVMVYELEDGQVRGDTIFIQGTVQR